MQKMDQVIQKTFNDLFLKDVVAMHQAQLFYSRYMLNTQANRL